MILTFRTNEVTSTTAVPTLKIDSYSVATNSTSGDWRPTEFDGCGSYLGIRLFIFISFGPNLIISLKFVGEGHIIGGTVTKAHELPFMALLGYKVGNGRIKRIEYQCGGTLINR